MRILIIGGTAFTGPHIVRRLHELGHQVTLFHRGQTEAALPDDIAHILGDREHLEDFADELRAIGPQIVLDMIPITEEHAQRVVSTFKGVAQRVVAISSQDVYRAYGRLIRIEHGALETLPITEDSPLRTKVYPYRERVGPDHYLYNYDKILVENVYMGDPELPATILRWPVVYGPRDRQHRLFPHLKRMDDDRPAILLEEGMAKWRWTRGYVEDVAVATVLAVIDDRAAGRIYNVGERDVLTEAEWVKAIGRAARWDGEVAILAKERLPDHLVTEQNTKQHLVVDTSRIREELGYKEQVPREEALRRTVAWERAHPPDRFDPAQFDYLAEDAVLAELGKSRG